MEKQDRNVHAEQNALARPVAFYPSFTMGLAVPKNGETLARLPSGGRLREAWLEHLGIDPLHNFLEKRRE
jgi:hypothetical protein